VLTTVAAGNITQTTAVSGGNVTSQGSSAVTARGVCWSTASNPTTSDAHSTDGSGTGNFTSNLTGLSPAIPYFVRAYATNSSGTGYGNQVTFTTLQGTGETVTDIDGNVYNTVTIGTQVWMAENLRTTWYNDGDSVPLLTDGTSWSYTTNGAYCWVNNDPAHYKSTYGALYNWFAVNTGKIAPAGWHVPTDVEWITLITYLGGDSLAGGKMKEKDTVHWFPPNTGATNSSGFTALPAGFRSNNPALGFGWLRSYGLFWGTPDSYADAYYVDVAYDASSTFRSGMGKNCGLSVRCVRNSSRLK
jgi:uncharacterized protein (TIGR02145 family)